MGDPRTTQILEKKEDSPWRTATQGTASNNDSDSAVIRRAASQGEDDSDNDWETSNYQDSDLKNAQTETEVTEGTALERYAGDTKADNGTRKVEEPPQNVSSSSSHERNTAEALEAPAPESDEESNSVKRAGDVDLENAAAGKKQRKGNSAGPKEATEYQSLLDMTHFDAAEKRDKDEVWVASKQDSENTDSLLHVEDWDLSVRERTAAVLGIAGAVAYAGWSGWSGKHEVIDGTAEKSLDHETLR